jgi:hypothetical protein
MQNGNACFDLKIANDSANIHNDSANIGMDE